MMRTTWILMICLAALVLCGMPGLALGQGPKLKVEPYAEADGAYPGRAFRLALEVRVPGEWHINAHKPLEDFLIPTALTLEPFDGVTITEMVYPEPEVRNFSFSDEAMAVYEGSIIIGIALELADSVPPGQYALKGTLKFQACNDTQCWRPEEMPVELPFQVVGLDLPTTKQHGPLFAGIRFGGDEQPPAQRPVERPPEQRPKPSETAEPPSATEKPAKDWRELAEAFDVTGRNSGYIKSDAFIQWIDEVEAGTTSGELNVFAGKSLWLVALLTLLGGLALNLTPCVLPLIPINLAIIGAGAQAGSKTRGFALGGLYGVGISLVYGVLGLVVVLTSGAFGTINASPWFNLVIAVVFVVLGLAMFDVLLIDFTKYQTKVGPKEKKPGSFLLAFVMGCIAALLAGACVAPVVIAVILFSRDLYAAGNPAGLVMPFLLGVGMALPWPFAGAGLSFLPKPGKWMVRVKYGFGIVIICFAAYYGYLAYTLFTERLVDEEAVVASTQTLDEEGWTSSLEEGLAQAKRENKPVLVDFWATWCKNCLTMNKTTFKDPAVTARLDDYVKVKYQAQNPGEAPAKDVMDAFGVGSLGLPIYVILEPNR